MIAAGWCVFWLLLCQLCKIRTRWQQIVQGSVMASLPASSSCAPVLLVYALGHVSLTSFLLSDLPLT